MSGATVRFEGVGKRWPDGSTALADVHLEVPAGTTLALLGSSGAGKSTLLRLLAGLEHLDTGRIVLDARAIAGPGVHVAPEARGVGMVFQALELWPHMSVAEHVAFGLPGRPRGRRARGHPDVLRLLEAVGLPADLLARRPDTLSGGEQQRVAIARALAAAPGVLLYDEPLANLDPDRRAVIRRLIRTLAREHGTTLLYVTHDPGEALELGDTVAVLAGGRLIEHGTPLALYRQPSTLLGAQALGPVTAVPAVADGGRARTPLGTFDADVADGPCVVLWRPESLRPDDAAPVRARVIDVTPRGMDFAFRASLGEVGIEGRSAEALDVGAEIGVAVSAPAGVVADDAPGGTA